MDYRKPVEQRQDDPTIVIINGKKRKSFEKKGVIYVQEGFSAEPCEVAKFEKIAYGAGCNKDYVYRRIMMMFNRSFGCGDNVKSPGDLYDKNDIIGRVSEAVQRVGREMGMV